MELIYFFGVSNTLQLYNKWEKNVYNKAYAIFKLAIIRLNA